MSDYKTDLRKMLRNLRLASGFTQGDVVKVLHLNRSSYTYYESGKTSPSIEALRKLAVLYKIPVEAFLYPEEYVGYGVEKIRQKAKRKPIALPQQIGDLTEEEKQCVIRFRMEKRKPPPRHLLPPPE